MKSQNTKSRPSLSIVENNEISYIIRKKFQIDPPWIFNELYAGLLTFTIVFCVGFFTRSFLIAVTTIICLIVVIIIPKSYLYFNKISAQKDRNEFAKNIIRSKGRARAPDFALYLRPFYIDDNISISTGARSMSFLFSDLIINFEDMLTQAVDPILPVVALGREARNFGPGQAPTTDEDWRAVALTLMQQARLIIAVPITEPSTIWELRQLVQGKFIDKTVFVVPPMINKTSHFSSKILNSTRSLDELYLHSSRVLRYEGLDLPVMPSNGGIFWYQSQNLTRPTLVTYLFSKKGIRYRDIRRVIFRDRGSSLESYKAPSD